LYHTDVLIHFFGWEPKSPAWYDGLCEGGSWEEGGGLRLAGRQHFDPDRVGRKHHRVVMASLSRACRRLERRGLVWCLQGAYSNWAAVEITALGKELWVNLVAE
jgi:hypothetical protein